ncbi:MAG TPA: 50S ribosomal protein L29 [Candidatus Pacearchaeota archaeon]|nr:50S ribosomal protein L29 [Candidatus Pacearchaeota archaeon]
MKYKEISKMTKEELDKKMKELKMELVKSKAKTSKTGNPREIKKLIARILTFNTSKQEKLKNK